MIIPSDFRMLEYTDEDFGKTQCARMPDLNPKLSELSLLFISSKYKSFFA